MRVFKTKSFARNARKEGVKDEALREAVGRAERGLVGADLGGGLIKQRVSRPGEGKRGGFRTIIAYRVGKRAVFLFMFAKSDQANISEEDKQDLKDYGAMLLALEGNGIDRMIAQGELLEMDNDEEGKKIPQ